MPKTYSFVHVGQPCFRIFCLRIHVYVQCFDLWRHEILSHTCGRQEKFIMAILYWKQGFYVINSFTICAYSTSSWKYNIVVFSWWGTVCTNRNKAMSVSIMHCTVFSDISWSHLCSMPTKLNYPFDSPTKAVTKLKIIIGKKTKGFSSYGDLTEAYSQVSVRLPTRKFFKIVSGTWDCWSMPRGLTSHHINSRAKTLHQESGLYFRSYENLSIYMAANKSLCGYSIGTIDPFRAEPPISSNMSFFLSKFSD